MDKSKVLAKLEEYKDRPVEITIDGANDMTLYGNIEGHWLLSNDDYVIHVTKNTSNGKYDIPGLTQKEKPFVIHVITFDEIKCIRSYIGSEAGDIKKDLGSCTPLASSKSIDDILKEIESDSIRRSLSTSGTLDVRETAPNGSYGRFTGSYISTSKDGIPQNVLKELLEKNDDGK